MRKYIFLLIAIFSIEKVIGQTNPYTGVKYPIEYLSPYWNNIDSKTRADINSSIENSIKRSFFNYNPAEYTLILENLCKVIESDKKYETEWISFMDSLKQISMSDVPRSGLIPLENQFLLATINNNRILEKAYPAAINFLKANTPPLLQYSFDRANYVEILKRYGFSEIKGEGIMFEVLFIEDDFVIKEIKKNGELLKKYKQWLNNLSDDAYGFEFSEDRCPEVLGREIIYVIEKLGKSDDVLAKESAPFIDNIRIFRYRPPADDSPLRVINGIWQGSFGDTKEIYFLNTYSNYNNEDNKVTGKSKFVGQPDRKYVQMVGNYKDNGDYFSIEMVEQPDTAQWNGVFKYQINKKTRIIKGYWQSNNGKLKRKFELKKISEDNW
ncbi:MAG TPA: hypothetical protein PLA24_07165 [Tenuifilaceae bacterium]|nr:hypothetical protein [Tenuifilaceae bacterium]